MVLLFSLSHKIFDFKTYTLPHNSNNIKNVKWAVGQEIRVMNIKIFALNMFIPIKNWK